MRLRTPSRDPRFFAAVVPIATLLLHAEAASATSPPCEPFAVLGSNVANGETSVPRDARLLVSYDGCGDKAEVVLLRDDVPVECDVTTGATTDLATWSSVKPRSPLDANASYVLKVTQRQTTSTIAFTTGDELAVTNTARPTVRIVSSAFTSAAGATGFASAKFDIELSPASPTHGGVLFLDKTAAAADEVARGAFNFAARDIAFDHGEPSARVSVDLAVRPGDSICFSGTYEDAAGRGSDPSESACGAVAGEPLPAPPAPAATGHGSNGGCSSTARGTPGEWAVAALASLLVLRRRRLARA